MNAANVGTGTCAAAGFQPRARVPENSFGGAQGLSVINHHHPGGAIACTSRCAALKSHRTKKYFQKEKLQEDASLAFCLSYFPLDPQVVDVI